MEYESMRQFADTWGLVFLFVVFVAVVLFTFRPGARKVHEESARIPLRED